MNQIEDEIEDQMHLFPFDTQGYFWQYLFRRKSLALRRSRSMIDRPPIKLKQLLDLVWY